ncbi:MAG TPA: PEP-CTERM sorting domain-containing protein [Terriglobia bacterium]
MKLFIRFSATLACALLFRAPAASINNGGFESGFAGWTRADQAGSDGTFALQTGMVSPVNGTAVPAPPGGSTAAMTDAQGPGAHVLYQTFTVTAPVPQSVLSFDLFIGNRAAAFSTSNSLDFATPTLNQQARVDILAGGADPFSVSAADLLMNLFQTTTGDALVSGYSHHASDITTLLNSHLNTPLMLRFAETDNVFTFQLGVDNVDIQETAVPEPSSMWLLMAGALFAVARIRQRAG